MYPVPVKSDLSDLSELSDLSDMGHCGILGYMGKPSREYLYGINPAFEAVRAGRRRIYQAFLNESSRNHPRLKKLAAFLDARDIPIEWVERGRVLDLSSSRENQGVVLKTSPYPYAASDELLAGDRLLLLDNVEDPHNVGAILRCAEVFGFHQVLLTRKGTPEVYPSVVKVSAGATEFLSIAKDRSATQYVQAALERSFTLVALDAKGTTPLESLQGAEMARLLLVIGGEDKSVGQFILNQAHHIASIEQRGRVNSLNASVAAGIAMHALRG